MISGFSGFTSAVHYAATSCGRHECTQVRMSCTTHGSEKAASRNVMRAMHESLFPSPSRAMSAHRRRYDAGDCDPIELSADLPCNILRQFGPPKP